VAAVLVQIDGYDPVAAAAVTLRCSSLDDDRVCHLNSLVWWPSISKLPPLRYDLFDGSFSGAITSPESSFELGVEPWPNFARYILADARIQIWTGEPGDAWGSYTQRLDGRVKAQPAIAAGVATFNFAVDDRWLDTPLLAPYAGTTGIEGEAAQKGMAKPLCIGAPRYVPGQIIDSVNTVVQVSAYGLIEDVEYALERLARFGASTGDYANYAALVAATIPAGSWATSKAYGLVRHGAPPNGKLSYLVKGDKAGPGGWVRLPGAVINRIALLSGGAGKIDAASLTALDAARPWNISVYVSAQTTARELIQKIAASVNAVAGVDWLGKLFVVPVGFTTPSATLDATGAALPPVFDVKQLEIDAPFWKLAIGAAPTWAVHSLTEVAFTATLVERGLYVSTESYREGHIADLPNGSRWLYINPSATIGNAPPSSGTSNTWWTQFAPPTSPADIGVTGLPVDLNRALVGGPAVVVINNAASGRPADRAQVQLTGVNGKAYWDNAPAPVTPGETIYYGHVVKSDISAGTDTCYAGVDFHGADGAVIGSTLLLTPETTCTGTEAIGAFVTKRTSFTVPADVAGARPYVIRPTAGTPAAKFILGEPYMGRSQQGADVTADSQVAVTVLTSVSVPATYTGDATANLPVYINPSVMKGATDIRFDDATSYAATITGGSGSIDTTNGSTTKGLITLSTMTSNTVTIDLVVTVASWSSAPIRITVAKEIAAPPSVGGTGSKLATDTSLTSINSTSYAAISDIMTVTLASGESLYGTAVLDYKVGGHSGANRTASVKWQYSPTGAGSWTDFAAAITGSPAQANSSFEDDDGFLGSGDFSRAKSGLSAATYDARLMAVLNGTGVTVNWQGGSCTVEAKV
jgi:hypothetical protein